MSTTKGADSATAETVGGAEQSPKAIREHSQSNLPASYCVGLTDLAAGGCWIVCCPIGLVWNLCCGETTERKQMCRAVSRCPGTFGSDVR
jgi:hypothetical protein